MREPRNTPLMTPGQIERFWAKVDKSDECWIWTAYRNKDGYGRARSESLWSLRTERHTPSRTAESRMGCASSTRATPLPA